MIHEANPIAGEPLEIRNGGARLAGTLCRPAGAAPAPALVVIHPASEGRRDSPFFRHLCAALPAAGIATLCYDRRGSGESEGDFASADFALLGADAAAAAAMVAAQPGIDARRIGFYGVSQGGWIAPLAVAGYPNASLLTVASGCGVSPAEQMIYTARTALAAAGYDAATVARAVSLRALVDSYYRGEVSHREVQAALAAAATEPWFPLTYLRPEVPAEVRGDKWFHEFAYDPLPAWASVTQPALFLYGESDAFVPIGESVRRYRSATAHLADVTMLQIPGADHLMSRPSASAPAEESGRVSDDYLRILCTWLRSRFGLAGGS